jgi:hypothetical protein
MQRFVKARLLPMVTAILCAATVSIPGWAKAPRRQSTVTSTEASRRSGRRGAEVRGGTEKWDITVTRADDHMLEGHVTRAGSTSLQGGRLRGTIAGRHVTGNVTDAGGTLVATFVGTITRSGGIRGTYHDHGGGAGHWSWDGPLLR